MNDCNFMAKCLQLQEYKVREKKKKEKLIYSTTAALFFLVVTSVTLLS